MTAKQSSTSTRQHRKRLTKHAIHAHLTHVGAESNALKRAARFALAKPETTQRAERLLVGVSHQWIHRGTVAAPVGMSKVEPARHAASDDELTSVLRTVMSCAKNNEAVGIVVTTFGTKYQVVNVHEYRVPATWHHTASTVAPHDFAADYGWNVLIGAVRVRLFARTHVGGGSRAP